MPTLTELRRRVFESNPGDWERVNCSGPTYLNRFGYVEGRDGPYLEHSEHYDRAVYKADVNLGLAWGMDVNRADDDMIAIPWREKFAAQHVGRWYVDLLWAGMLLNREMVYVVDGGRFVLPNDSPALVAVGDGITDVEEFASTASPWRTHIAQLIHGIDGYPGSFDDGMRRAGIVGVGIGDRASVIAIEATEHATGEYPAQVPTDIERIARQEWPDYDLELGVGPIRDWLFTAVEKGAVVGFALLSEETVPSHVHLHQIVVDSDCRGSGIGAALVVAVARHAVDEIHATVISVQPAWGERHADRERWFRDFGFERSDTDDELHGIWFASAERVALGRISGRSRQDSARTQPTGKRRETMRTSET